MRGSDVKVYNKVYVHEFCAEELHLFHWAIVCVEVYEHPCVGLHENNKVNPESYSGFAGQTSSLKQAESINMTKSDSCV